MICMAVLKPSTLTLDMSVLADECLVSTAEITFTVAVNVSLAVLSTEIGRSNSKDCGGDREDFSVYNVSLLIGPSEIAVWSLVLLYLS
jgi:hypothetical protein